MVRNYERKPGSNLLKWDQDDMINAVNAVLSGDLSFSEACIVFQVPVGSLHRRVQKTKNNTSIKKLGHQTVFTEEQEKALSDRLLCLEKKGFPLTMSDLRKAAFTFAEQLNVRHPFKNGLAGKDWAQSFLKRNSVLSLRRSGLSLNRATGVTKERVAQFYKLLEETLAEHQLFQKPGLIFNMDETGMPMNKRPVRTIETKGKKKVYSIMSAERGEHITVIACCSAAGVFIPPAVIFKGIRKRHELELNMPVGARVYMTETGCINETTFLLWLEHFIHFKPAGKVLLILDGHTSHVKNMKVIDMCLQHNIVLLCLPSHTRHVLRPLDKSIFKPLKSFYFDAVNNWAKNHPGQKLSKLQFGALLSAAWNKAATAGNAAKGFKACGIFPFNNEAIPDWKYAPSILADREETGVSVVEETIANRLNAANPVTDIDAPSTSHSQPTSRMNKALSLPLQSLPVASSSCRIVVRAAISSPVKPKTKKRQHNTHKMQDSLLGTSQNHLKT